MRTKLSYINDTPENKTGWHAKTPNFPYSVAEANDVQDVNNVFSQKSLAAIPSPLARIHIFETAFEFVTKQQTFSGTSVFHIMVSHILDVWEMLFNYRLHKDAGLDISIQTWDGISELNQLANSHEINHQHVGKILRQYLTQGGFANMNQRFDLIFIDRHLVAGTSPFTGFFTSIDCDAMIDLPHPNSSNNRKYFRGRPVSILEREPEFVKYLYTLLFHPYYTTQFPALFKYLDAIYQDLNLWQNNRSLYNQVNDIYNTNPKTEPSALYSRIATDMGSDLSIAGLFIFSTQSGTGQGLDSPLLLDIDKNKLPAYLPAIPLVWKDSHNFMEVYDSTIHVTKNESDIPFAQRVLPGTGRRYPFLCMDDFLENTIFRIPFLADDTRFQILLNDEESLKSYLCPLKPLFFDIYPDVNLDRIISADKTSDGIVIKLRIKIQNGRFVEYRKFYASNPQLDGYGKIEDVTFDIGFFPFYRISNPTPETEYLNKDNRVHITYNTANFEGSDVDLQFFKSDNSLISLYNGIYDLTRPGCKMNRVDDGNGLKSDIYAIKEDYRIVQVRIGRFYNYIIPKFDSFRLGHVQFNIAVDFGTTNTHIALSSEEGSPAKFSIDENEMQTVPYSVHVDSGGLTISERYAKEAWQALGSMQSIIHQFVPPIIGVGQNPYYDFPTRTVVSHAKNRGIHPLFTANVAFYHSKDRIRPDETTESELKWELSGKTDKQELTQAYLEQLLMMIKHKVVLNQGDPAKMKLIWFLPLSLDQPSMQFFKNNWIALIKRVFPGVALTLHQISESEAPFYLFQSVGRVFGEENTLCIDVGGGSTDVSFFEKGVPVFFTSFNFAGNTLWNNGYHGQNGQNKILDYYSNLGIQNLMAPIMGNQNLRIMFESAREQLNHSTLDMMNFYFAWDQFINFSAQFHNDQNIKFLFLFHYSSILFHIYKICEALNINFPKYLCYSGKGSKMLHAIDTTPDKSSLRKYTIDFLSSVAKKNNHSTNFQNISINLANNEKEVTCNGGIEYLKTKNPTTAASIEAAKFMIASGDVRSLEKAYRIDAIDNLTKNNIVSDVVEFLESFAQTTKSFNLQHHFGINIDHLHLNKLNGTKVDIYSINDEVTQNVREALERGITFKKTRSGMNQQISESPFFFPLVQLIHEMGNELYK